MSEQQDKPGARFTISCVLDGFPVQVEIEGRMAQLRATIKRLIDEGATPPQGAGSSKRPLPKQAPEYADDGTPTCPYHHRALKAGQYGWYCSSRAEGEIANDKGYCRYVWRDE